MKCTNGYLKLKFLLWLTTLALLFIYSGCGKAPNGDDSTPQTNELIKKLGSADVEVAYKKLIDSCLKGDEKVIKALKDYSKENEVINRKVNHILIWLRWNDIIPPALKTSFPAISTDIITKLKVYDIPPFNMEEWDYYDTYKSVLYNIREKIDSDDKNTYKHLTGDFVSLLKKMRGPEWCWPPECFLQIIKILGKLGLDNKEAVDELVSVFLVNDYSDYMGKEGVIYNISLVKDISLLPLPEISQKLIRLLYNSNNIHVRESSAACLAKLGIKSAGPHIVNLLRTEIEKDKINGYNNEHNQLSNPFRNSLAVAAGYLKEESAIPLIRPLLKTTVPWNCHEVVEALVMLEGNKSIPYLAECLFSETDRGIRRDLINALEELTGQSFKGGQEEEIKQWQQWWEENKAKYK